MDIDKAKEVHSIFSEIKEITECVKFLENESVILCFGVSCAPHVSLVEGLRQKRVWEGVLESHKQLVLDELYDIKDIF